MTIPFQAYTNGGIVRGTIEGEMPLEELLQQRDALDVVSATHSLLGGGKEQAAQMRIELDELLLIADTSDTPVPIHASWHEVATHIGPFRVDGELATQPGFDPGRALARPGGEFVLLRDVRVALVDDPAGAADEHPWAWVNRYLVERVRSSIELGHFFPGAEPEPVVVAAPDHATSPQPA
jgi:hypothetical protein